MQNALGDFSNFFYVISFLGHPAFWFLVAAVLYWNSREKESFWLINLVVFTSVVIGALKGAFARPRPSAAEFRVFGEPAFVSKLGDAGMSFPSGHAGIIAAITKFFYGPILQIKKINIFWIGIFLILLVGLSRLVLGLHFLSDVLAGIAIGGLMGFAAWQTHLRLEKKGFKLSQMDDELGFLLTMVLAIFLMVAIAPPLLAAVVLGYYAGFFGANETGFVQSKVSGNKRIAKSILGLIGTGVLAFWGLNHPIFMEQFIVFFAIGFWVTAAWPWLFERVFLQSKKPLKTVSKHK